MAFVINLPEELENELVAEANRRGVPLVDYAVHVLSEWRMVENLSPLVDDTVDRGTPAGDASLTGQELVAYWQREGLIGTRSDIVDSQEHARKIRTLAERRIRTTF